MIGLLLIKDSRFLFAVSNNRTRASKVAQAICGVIMQFFADNKGLSFCGGSFERTSNPAPANSLLLRASAKSGSTIKPPREVFIKNAEDFINLILSLLIIPSVSFVSGQCKLITSEEASNLSNFTHSKFSTFFNCFLFGSVTSIFIPIVSATWATFSPIRPNPTIPIVLLVSSICVLSQKQKSCSNCFGKGCRICDFHGILEFDSVEGMISQFIFKKFGGTTAKFTWIGGEDKSSLVLGTGRPFFVKIQNPFKRNLKLTSKTFDFLKITNLKFVTESPKKPLKFNSSIEVKISTEDEIDSKNLKKLNDLAKHPIVVYEKSGKRSEKKVFSVKYKKNSKNTFTLFIKTEGGLPVKRFVNSDDVSPGISQILNMSCKCQEFDFLDVEVQ